MENIKFTFKTFSRVLWKEATIFFVKNWFSILLLGAIVHFSIQKDINLEFSMSTSSIFDQSEKIVLGELSSNEDRIHKPRLEKNSFGLGSFLFTSKKSDNGTTNQVPVKSKIKGKSHPSFLSFIFHDDLSGEHPFDPSLLSQQQVACQKYIDRFAPVAVSEMHKYGIPASIKLAQALLESNVGTNQLSQEFDNHFGVKCFSKKCKPGHCKTHNDDIHKDFYRKYENAWASFRGHSLLLHQKRYQHLLEIGKSDYKNWAHGLKKSGYSPDEYYAEKLIRIIEILNLDRFDRKSE